MRCDEPDVHVAFTSIRRESSSSRHHPYASSPFHHNAPANQNNLRYCSTLASLASSSTSSVSSDSSSQFSDEGSQRSASTAASSADSDPFDSYRHALLEPSQSQTCDHTPRFTSNPSTWTQHQMQKQRPLHVEIPVPPELRQHPRRSSNCSTTRSGCPPSLVRQADRKVNFVDNLVDSSTQIVEAIWPTSSVLCRSEASNSVLPLRTFIQETLRRSRTSYSTLQVALYYLILIKPHVPEHDFTMEQPEDCHTSRVLQCGRRMFLAALILASKYLQDRNYSARAWSKISGLATQEINQNEMAFLLAVDWKLHVTTEIYHRWTDQVMKFTPPQPPSPGGPAAQRLFELQCEDFRSFILKLTPGLENVEQLMGPGSPSKARPNMLHDFAVASSPRSLFSLSPPADRHCAFGSDVAELAAATATPPRVVCTTTPMVMEPSPATVYTPGRLAPALGLLPTPRLTPHSSGFSTPAVSAASYLLKGSSMSLAMAQATSANNAYTLDRWSSSSAPMTSSPQSYFTATRRSSLANSISTVSSPESMVSDLSRASRSSSISSASSLVSAPLSSLKLDIQARCRYAKQCNERLSLRPIIATVPEDYEENSCAVTSSPETYTGPVGKDSCAVSAEPVLVARGGKSEMDDNDAARALQDLHNYHMAQVSTAAPFATEMSAKPGSKRSRPLSIDNGLQDNVRNLLREQLPSSSGSVSDAFVRRGLASGVEQVPLRACLRDGPKRVCCSTEAAQQFPMSSLHPAVGGMGGPGMWDGILN